MDKLVFKQVQDSNTKDFFRIIVDIGDKTFNITILKKSNSWTGSVDEESILSFAREFEINHEEYFNRVKEYFTTTPGNVDFHFSKTEFVITYNSEKNMKIKYFSCKLKKVDYNNQTEQLLETFYKERNNALERLEGTVKDKNAFEKSKTEFEIKLNEFIESKKTEEQELYNNFVLVLNEKKKRIQHLNELLEAFRRGRPTVNPPVEVKKRTKKRENQPEVKEEVKNEVSESDSEDGYDTDEEKRKKRRDDVVDDDIDLVDVKNEKVSAPEFVTLENKYDLFADDSPPRRLLPKRIKSEPVIESHILDQPSTSKSTENKNVEKNISVDPTPNVMFSTQDLLDNL